MKHTNTEELIAKHEYCEYKNCPFCYAKANKSIQDSIDKKLDPRGDNLCLQQSQSYDKIEAS